MRLTTAGLQLVNCQMSNVNVNVNVNCSTACSSLHWQYPILSCPIDHPPRVSYSYSPAVQSQSEPIVSQSPVTSSCCLQCRLASPAASFRTRCDPFSYQLYFILYEYCRSTVYSSMLFIHYSSTSMASPVSVSTQVDGLLFHFA